MIMFDVRIFAVDRGTYLSTIYNISYHCPDSIWEDSSIEENDQGVLYFLDDTIINFSDFEDMEK